MYVIQILDTEISQIIYKGDPVITFAMVDEIHKRPEGTAKRNFHDNRDRFFGGADFIELGSDEIRTNLPDSVFSKFTPKGILLTKRGYLKLVKPMNDDRAWEVQVEMIDRYFAVERLAALAASDRGAIGGIVKGIIHRELTEILPLMIEREIASKSVTIRRGVPAKTVWDRFSLPGKLRGSTCWLGNRLDEMGCNMLRADRGGSAVRLYDPDLAEACMRNGLLHKARVYASERMGQGKFKLIGGDQ